MPNLRSLRAFLTSRKLVPYLLAVGVILLILFPACKRDDDNITRPVPGITVIVPDSAFVGDTITLTGTNFSTNPIENTITFSNNVEAFGIVSASATTLRVKVPQNAVTGAVTVTVDGQRSNEVNFKVRTGAAFAITSISPTSGYFGDTVTITGSGFKPSDFLQRNDDGSYNTVVYFGEAVGSLINAVVISVTSTELKVRVPDNIQTGAVRIRDRLSNTTIQGPTFSIAPPAPTIASFDPVLGAEGTVVTISGTNYRRDVQVTFNGINLPISNSSPTQLQVTIPAGIAPGEYPFVISAQGNTVTSTTNFTVTSPLAANRYIYYTLSDIIYRASINEQDGQVDISTVPLFSGIYPQDLAIDSDNNKIYWADYSYSNIASANLDGTGTPHPVFNQGAQSPMGVSFAGGKLYWFENSINSIMRGNVDGTGSEVLFGPEDGVTTSYDVEIDILGNKIYWTEINEKRVLRGNIDGSGTPEVLFDAGDGLEAPYGVKIDVASNKIYITDAASMVAGIKVPNDRIWVGNLNGTGSLTSLFQANDGVAGVTGIALDKAAGKIYWLTFDYDTYTGKMMRGNLDGSGTREVIVDNYSAPAGYIVVQEAQ